MIDGQFPDWHSVVPKTDATVLLDREAFIEALQAVKHACSEESTAVKLTFNADHLLIEAKSHKNGYAKTQILLDEVPPQMQLGLDPEYLIEACTALTGDTIVVQFRSCEHGVSIHDGAPEMRYQLVMPIDFGDRPTVPKEPESGIKEEGWNGKTGNWDKVPDEAKALAKAEYDAALEKYKQDLEAYKVELARWRLNNRRNATQIDGEDSDEEQKLGEFTPRPADSPQIGQKLGHVPTLDELHAKAFIADLEQALAGGQIISKSVAPLSRDFTAPAAGATADLWVECFQGFPAAEVFAAGDYVMVRTFDRSGGGLTIANCFGTVSAPYFPSPQSDPPEQRWTFTRLSGTVGGHPAAGYMGTGQVVRRGTLALDFGVSGNGYHEVNAIDGLMGENSPYNQTVKWATHPWYDRTVTTRTGNLKGIFNVAGEYGLYAGTGVTDASQFVRISNQAVEAHNLPVKLYDGSNVAIMLQPATNPYIAMGVPIPTGWLTQSGWWAGKSGGYYRQYLGTVSGGDLSLIHI